MDLAPLLCIVRVMEIALLFLIRRLLLVIPAIFAISSVSCVDFPIILLLLWGPLATGLKKLSPGFISLNAYVSNCK
jgi:ABC-type microcin C transport system permease subunit YejB